MSENFVRKTLNVEKIGKKETYTLHDLDLVETKDGHVFIRIFKQNAEPNSTDQNAYLYELTNSMRRVNNMSLDNPEQLNNTGNLPLPLVMELQYLSDSVKVSMVGNTTDIYKINGLAGVFKNKITTYTIPLTGDTLPDITVKQGNTVIDVYKLHQADLRQTNPLHPEYVKGAKECCDRLGALETRVDKHIQPPVIVETNGRTVNIEINTDQPDDPFNNPTRPACLDDIEVFYQDGENMEKLIELNWEHELHGQVLKPDTTNEFLHCFYRWYIQLHLPQNGYAVVKRNGIIVSSVYVVQGGGDIS